MNNVFNGDARIGKEQREERRQNHASADAEKAGEKARAAAEGG